MTKDKEKIKMYNLRYRETHPDTKNIRQRKETKETKRAWNIKSRYRITLEQVESMLLKQGGKCAICDCELDKYKIDHDHNNGNVRGLLCHKCNLLIAGIERENFLSKALKYLGVR